MLRHSRTKARDNGKLKLRPKPARLAPTLPVRAEGCEPPPLLDWSSASSMRPTRGASSTRCGRGSRRLRSRSTRTRPGSSSSAAMRRPNARPAVSANRRLSTSWASPSSAAKRGRANSWSVRQGHGQRRLESRQAFVGRVGLVAPETNTVNGRFSVVRPDGCFLWVRFPAPRSLHRGRPIGRGQHSYGFRRGTTRLAVRTWTGWSF